MASARRINEVEQCDLCVVGAGIAGMNALYAASKYLGPEHRVILVDTNARPGGMWIDTYDYVRLHQPHPMFTAGDIPWTIDEPPAHLAAKNEVLDHFQHCIEVLKRRITLVELYGCAYESHDEIARDGSHEVHIRCTDETTAERTTFLVRAKRLVKAIGFNVAPNEPLSFSSDRVRSISPHDRHLLGEEMRCSDKPVYIVGGGKTAMDTAHELITRYPGKAVNLIVGRGTLFANRNRAFPAGLRRWWLGTPGLRVFLDVALRYTGDNDEEAFDYWRRNYSIGLRDSFQQYFLGLLSEEENEVIERGVSAVMVDYLEDIVDSNGAPQLVFRSGKRTAIEPGSWVVNCTGHLLREQTAYEPFVSEHGAVVSIQPTSSVHILTTFASYFLVHLLYLGKLRTLPLYEVNFEQVLRSNRVGFPLVCMTQILYNTMTIIDAVPIEVVTECGLDFDRWYPLHRRLLAAMKLKRHRREYTAHFRRTLDRIQEKYGITCGVLPAAANRSV